MVSAFATRQRLVLGQVEVADKSNEIVAIPKLLELLAIERVDASLDGADIRLRIEGLTKLVEDLRAIKPESRRAA
jgi:hypothetical protein